MHKNSEKERAQTLTTAVHLPRKTWELLRAVAFRKAERTGGRASVSSLIVELVEAQRKALEKRLQDNPLIDESSIDEGLG